MWYPLRTLGKTALHKLPCAVREFSAEQTGISIVATRTTCSQMCFGPKVLAALARATMLAWLFCNKLGHKLDKTKDNAGR